LLAGAGGTGIVAGSNTQIQFNNNGVFGASAGLTFDGTNFATTGTATAAKLIPTGTSVTGNGMYLPATNSVGISTAGTNAVYIDASQNVGIGTSSPGAKLDVTGNIKVSGQITAVTSIYSPLVSAAYVSGTSNLYLRNLSGANHIDSYNDPITATYPLAINASTISLQIADSTKVTIGSSGNVGIGTTSTTGVKLNVNAVNGWAGTFYANSGGASTTGLSNYGITFGGNYSGGSAEVNVIYGSVGAGLDFSSYDGTTVTQRMRLDSSGNLLVNATSPATNCQNTIVGASTGVNLALGVIHNATTNVVRGLLVKCPNFNGNDGYLMIGARSGGDVAYMYSNGNWTNLNNSYGALSDIKLKENIADATPKLEKINQVRVVTYNLKSDPSQKQIGVIAQELEQVFPSMVEETADRDTEGNELDTKTKYVKYSVFVPILIKSIQEQQALITTLTARIEALEAK
jgi:hypothetical protein